MYKWVQKPGVVERFKQKGEGGGGTTNVHLPFTLKYISNMHLQMATYGCCQRHNPLEILSQSSQRCPIQICSGEDDQV